MSILSVEVEKQPLMLWIFGSTRFIKSRPPTLPPKLLDEAQFKLLLTVLSILVLTFLSQTFTGSADFGLQHVRVVIATAAVVTCTTTAAAAATTTSATTATTVFPLE